jgi:hypothetical protein
VNVLFSTESSAAARSGTSVSVRNPIRPTSTPSTAASITAATRTPRRNVPSPPIVTISSGRFARAASSAACSRPSALVIDHTSMSVQPMPCSPAHRRTAAAAATACCLPVCTTSPIALIVTSSA